MDKFQKQLIESCTKRPFSTLLEVIKSCCCTPDYVWEETANDNEYYLSCNYWDVLINKSCIKIKNHNACIYRICVNAEDYKELHAAIYEYVSTQK